MKNQLNDKEQVENNSKSHEGYDIGRRNFIVTSAVAAVCGARKTDFLAVRCITDNVHENLPDEFNDYFVLGQLRPDRVFASCARDPRVLADLARLGYRAKHSGQKLARFLETAVAQLHFPALAARHL